MVPTRTGNPGKTGEHFPGKSQEILPKLLEKVRKNYTAKFREICQPLIVITMQMWYHTLNNKKTAGLMAQLSAK